MIYLFCLICLLSSCSQPPITAQTEYVTRCSLASYRIGTPDPNLNHPVLGQRLIINWSLKNCQNTHMDIVLRFHSGSERNLSLPICKSSGSTIYSLSAEDFCQTQGIASYKIDILENDTILYSWRHQLWVDLITVN